MTSEVFPVWWEITGLRHPATADVAGCIRPPPLLPRPPRHLPRLPGDANSFSPGSLKRRRISDSRRSVRSRTFCRGVHSRGLQRGLGATRRRPLRGGVSEGSCGRLHCPGCGGLNRRSRTRRGDRTKLGGPETYSRELAACVQDRINMRYHTLQYCPKTIHRLI